MTGLAYQVVDVFTDRRYAGNPLAVVLGADDLTTGQCQQLAAEFNLSETAFPVVRSAGAAADYRLRIFTPRSELPFAGHPSLGAAWVQREVGAVAGPRIVQECGAGLLPLTFHEDGSIELTGGTPTLGPPLPDEQVAALLEGCGLTADDRRQGPSARVAGTGSEFTFVVVSDDAVARAAPNGALVAALGATAGHGLALLSWDGRAHLRMFAPGLGVNEDPATGSATTALGVYLVAERLLPGDGESSYRVSQGSEMGRPSLLRGTVLARAGAAVRCQVAGHVVPVATGSILPPSG